MATRESSTSPVLIAIVLLLTFPFWITIAAALFGVVIGIFGAAIGVIAAVFGALVALIALPFKIIFGWNDWHSDWLPHFHFNGFWLAVVIIVAALIIRGKKDQLINFCFRFKAENVIA